MNLYATISDDAIATAQRNADKAEAAGYYVTSGTLPGSYLVHKNENEFYVCQTTVGTRGKCECEQWKKVHYCKHLELCERYEGWIESVEAREQDFDTNEEGRFFMMEALLENLAETEGAWC
jgi:hypothetical protein